MSRASLGEKECRFFDRDMEERLCACGGRVRVTRQELGRGEHGTPPTLGVPMARGEHGFWRVLRRIRPRRHLPVWFVVAAVARGEAHPPRPPPLPPLPPLPP